MRYSYIRWYEKKVIYLGWQYKNRCLQFSYSEFKNVIQ